MTGGGENLEPKKPEEKQDFGKVLDDKLSVFGKDIVQKVEQKVEQVSDKVDNLETKFEKPDTEPEFEDDAERERYEAMGKKAEERAEKKAEQVVEKKLTEKDAQDERARAEAKWTAKAHEDFSDMTDKGSELWKRAEKIYNTMPESSRAAEDAVYTCAVRAERALQEEAKVAKNADKTRQNNAKKNAAAGGTSEEDTDEGATELTAEQRKICKQHRLDPKKYAARIKAGRKP